MKRETLFLDKTGATLLSSFHVDFESYPLGIALLTPGTLEGLHFAMYSPVVLVKISSVAKSFVTMMANNVVVVDT